MEFRRHRSLRNRTLHLAHSLFRHFELPLQIVESRRHCSQVSLLACKLDCGGRLLKSYSADTCGRALYSVGLALTGEDIVRNKMPFQLSQLLGNVVKKAMDN